jgi:hypothetical protein
MTKIEKRSKKFDGHKYAEKHMYNNSNRYQDKLERLEQRILVIKNTIAQILNNYTENLSDYTLYSKHGLSTLELYNYIKKINAMLDFKNIAGAENLLKKLQNKMKETFILKQKEEQDFELD